MPYDQFGQFRPSRRSKFHCSSCRRAFAADAVPAPGADGRRICRDCLIATYSPTSLNSA